MRTAARSERVQLNNGCTLVVLSDTLATILAPDGSRKAACFGFDLYEQMLAFSQTLIQQGITPVGRRSVYLKTAWEIEAIECSTEIVVKFYNSQCTAQQPICRSPSLG